ncbi:oligosaccharide flippase family protein [uncultured Acetatifactor sp.]|uniref:oligosaccharide flippase family protein n=1 Tax=uncultured Acetatifactor sp. TaxID=1671927 RepID=UPI0026114BA7|nr:oligosaccharide flippase family protein [uncultured Acetatifactor sp.]
MNKGKSLFTNYIYNVASQLLGIIISLITAPYMARVLREVGNGQIAFANSVVAYFVSFAGFGFWLYGQREISKAKDDIDRISILFSEIFWIRLIFSIVSLAIYLLLISTPLIGNEYKLLALINSIQIIAVVFDIQFFYQGMEDFKTVAIRIIFVRLISVVSMFLFIHSPEDVWKYLLYYSTIGLISNLVLWPHIKNKITLKKSNILALKKHIVPALFIFLPVLSGTIFSVLDSTMIGYLASNPEYENGCYGTALKLINIVSTIVMADGLVFAARNARDNAVGNYDSLARHIKLGFRYVWIIGFPIIGGLLTLSSRISICIFGDGYEKVPLLLQIFTVRVLAHGIMNVLGNQYFLQTGREKLCTIVNFIGIIINILLNIVLIPRGGCIGAAIASVISETILIAIYIIVFIRERKYWNASLFLQSYKYIFSTIVMSLVVLLVNRFLEQNIISLMIVVVLGATIYGGSLLLLKDELAIFAIRKVFGRYKR